VLQIVFEIEIVSSLVPEGRHISLFLDLPWHRQAPKNYHSLSYRACEGRGPLRVCFSYSAHKMGQLTAHSYSAANSLGYGQHTQARGARSSMSIHHETRASSLERQCLKPASWRATNSCSEGGERSPTCNPQPAASAQRQARPRRPRAAL
jgi:hypothetical protein